MRIADMLFASSERHADKAAVYDDYQEVTYAQLVDRVARLAASLQQRYGIEPGDRVAVWSTNCVELLEVMLAANLIGAVTELYNALWSVRVVASLLEKHEVGLVFVGRSAAFAPLFDEAPATVKVSFASDGRGQAYRELVRGGSAAYVAHEVQDDDVALEFFTSGTTSTPKCVMHTNKSIVLRQLTSSITLPWQQSDVMLTGFPLYHVGGLGVLASLLNGATTVLTTATKADELALLIDTHRVTRAMLVPLVIHRLVEIAENNEEVNLSSLRTISYGSSCVSSKLLQRCNDVLGCDLFQVYGMTEMAGSLTSLTVEDHADPALLDSVGKPVPGVFLKVVNEDGSVCAPGQTGEIVARAYTAMKGYRDEPELTRAALADGWYHTRDMGFLDERGYLYVRGRKDGMIISGGENIFPQELQSCIAELEDEVLEAAVIGTFDRKWGQCPVAFVVKRPGASLSEERVRDWCGERLGHYKRPKSVYFMDRLPRNGSGKVSLIDLRTYYQQVVRADET